MKNRKLNNQWGMPFGAVSADRTHETFNDLTARKQKNGLSDKTECDEKRLEQDHWSEKTPCGHRPPSLFHEVDAGSAFWNSFQKKEP